MAILDSLRNSGVVVHDIREKNKCRESLIGDEAEYSGRLFIHGSVLFIEVGTRIENDKPVAFFDSVFVQFFYKVKAVLFVRC
jgi:hypothetical protein